MSKELSEENEPFLHQIHLPMVGLRLFSEDMFLNDDSNFGALGMSRRTFRALCAALSVPVINIGTRHYVDPYAFSLAMTAVARPGRPNFDAPGSDNVRRGSRKDHVRTLDHQYLNDYLPRLTAELLARRVTATESPLAVSAAVRNAFERMVTGNLHGDVDTAQRQRDQHNMQAATLRGAAQNLPGMEVTSVG